VKTIPTIPINTKTQNEEKSGMTKKQMVILLCTALALAAPSASSLGYAPFEVRPPEGFVPDAETATKVSEVILVRIFGEAEINFEKPLTASLQGDTWFVRGTMPPNMLGGVAEIRISKKDARVLFLKHEK